MTVRIARSEFFILVSVEWVPVGMSAAVRVLPYLVCAPTVTMQVDHEERRVLT
jgi:hypothetical protein